MLVAILILVGVVVSIWAGIDEGDPFTAFLGLLFTGVVGFCLMMMVGLFYYPNQHETIHELEKLSTKEYVQIADDTYTFKVDGKVIVQNKDDLSITILPEKADATAKVTKDPGGFNHLGYESSTESYELRVPSDAVEKVS